MVDDLRHTGWRSDRARALTRSLPLSARAARALRANTLFIFIAYAHHLPADRRDRGSVYLVLKHRSFPVREVGLCAAGLDLYGRELAATHSRRRAVVAHVVIGILTRRFAAHRF